MLLRIAAIVGMSLGGLQSAMAQSESIPEPSAVATAAAQQVSVYHSGWASLLPDGTLKGRVVVVNSAGSVTPQPGASVAIMQGGTVIGSTQADVNGEFQIPGLKAGVYELTSDTSNSFAAVSFQALPAPQDGAAKVMDVYASSMPRSEVDRVLQSMWAPQQGAAVAPPSFESLVAPVMPSEQSQRVKMVGGVVNGQVAFSNPNNVPEAHVVKVFRGGQQVAMTKVDAMGRFSFPLQSAGPIDVVVGGSAFGTVGADVVDASQPQLSRQDADGNRYVSHADSMLVADTLLVPTIGGGGSDQATPPPAPAIVDGGFAPPFFGGGGAPMYGGGGGGGFGGGGGGGFGGGFGGIGGLMGIAGLAVGVVALADDDDGFTSAPSTPVAP